MRFLDGPLFDFNGNGKLDFHEFMTVADGMRKLQENDENQFASSYEYNFNVDNDNNNENNW